METVWRFLSKLKIELQYDPALLHLDIYLDIYLDKTVSKRCMPPHIHSSTVHNSQDTETS